MGQFRLRKKYRSDGDSPEENLQTSSGITASKDDSDFRFRPKTFVSKPRDQIDSELEDSSKTGVRTELRDTLIVRVHDKPKLPKVGSVLGKCRLTKQIGKGSSCLVFTALHQALQIDVAVKVFLPEENAGMTSMHRFRDQFKIEAQTLAKLNNPNIVRVLDFEDAALPYMILEYVDGQSLMARIKRDGVLPALEGCTLMRAICDGLAAAHERGIVHRDIKPENILIDRNGSPKLADLGIAKITSQINRDDKRTARGILCGTPAYVAPEQALDPDAADACSDIYSLGATFYHMITGRYPFDAAKIEEMISKHISQEVVPPHIVRPNIPIEVSNLIVAMMRKDPRQRPTLAAVRAAVDNFIRRPAPAFPDGDSDDSLGEGSSTIAFLRQTIIKTFKRKPTDK